MCSHFNYLESEIHADLESPLRKYLCLPKGDHGIMIEKKMLVADDVSVGEAFLPEGFCRSKFSLQVTLTDRPLGDYTSVDGHNAICLSFFASLERTFSM